MFLCMYLDNTSFIWSTWFLKGICYLHEQSLFIWGFTSHSTFSHKHGYLTITSAGLRILTYARHSWLFSSDEFVMCHTYYDTDEPFMMVGSGAVTTC